MKITIGVDALTLILLVLCILALSAAQVAVSLSESDGCRQLCG